MTMRTCDGSGCDQRRDCVRWLRRADEPHAERFQSAPWRLARVLDAHGRPLGTEQACDYLVTRAEILT